VTTSSENTGGSRRQYGEKVKKRTGGAYSASQTRGWTKGDVGGKGEGKEGRGGNWERE